MYKINSQIFKAIELDNTPQEERYFVIDDTILAKLGKKIENVSYIYDHNIGRSVLGFCVVILGLFTAHGFTHSILLTVSGKSETIKALKKTSVIQEQAVDEEALKPNIIRNWNWH